MVNPIVLDIIALILIVLAVLEGRRKGLVKMLWKVAAWIVTLVLVLALVKPVTDWAMCQSAVIEWRSGFDNMITDYINQNALFNITPEEISEATNVPLMFIPENLGGQVFLDDFTMPIANTITEILIKSAAALGLFIIIRILLSILYHILNLVTKLPIIKGVNKLLGMVMGLINIMFIFYIALGIAAIYIEPGSQWDIAINNTYLVKNFYNNNILLNLINL